MASPSSSTDILCDPFPSSPFEEMPYLSSSASDDSGVDAKYQTSLLVDDDEDGSSILIDFPDWDEIPSDIRAQLKANRHATLQNECGLALYRFGSEDKRYALLTDTFDYLLIKIDSGRDSAIIADALHPYMAHKAQLCTRYPNDIHSVGWHSSDEKKGLLNPITEAQVKQVLGTHLSELVDVIDDHLLFKADPRKTRRRIVQLKTFLKDANDGSDFEPIKIELHRYEKALELRSTLGGSGKTAIINHYLNASMRNLIAREAPVIQGNTNWFPCRDYDVNLNNGMIRRRWLHFNVTNTANANYTVPAKLARTRPSKWSNKDRETYFGLMDKLFNEISANDSISHREILTSLYLQLLGHNHDKYLLFWVGKGHNGKSLLLSLLRRVLGGLAASLDKRVLFRVKGKAKPAHGGYELQLTDIRSGTIDELSCQDELDDDAVKRIVSADVILALRTPYKCGSGAVKAQHNISCSILMCYNDGSLPKFHQDEAMLNRIRIIRFPALFVNRDVTEEEQAQGNVFRADTELATELQDPHVQEQFLNYVITYGRFYYWQAKQAGQEPLPPNEEAHQLRRNASTPIDPIPVTPAMSDNLRDWFTRRVAIRPDARVATVQLAALWCKDLNLSFKKPEREFNNRLGKQLPDIAKNRCTEGSVTFLVGYDLIDFVAD